MVCTEGQGNKLVKPELPEKFQNTAGVDDEGVA